MCGFFLAVKFLTCLDEVDVDYSQFMFFYLFVCFFYFLFTSSMLIVQ